MLWVCIWGMSSYPKFLHFLIVLSSQIMERIRAVGQSRISSNIQMTSFHWIWLSWPSFTICLYLWSIICCNVWIANTSNSSCYILSDEIWHKQLLCSIIFKYLCVIPSDPLEEPDLTWLITVSDHRVLSRNNAPKLSKCVLWGTYSLVLSSFCFPPSLYC
jgi:hypothetical protein